MRASVSGLMALLVLWFFPLNIFIHSFKIRNRITVLANYTVFQNVQRFIF